MPEPTSRPVEPPILSPLRHSLSVRLFLWLLAICVGAFAALAWIIAATTSEHWMQSLRLYADRSSGLVKRAIHQGMLLNRQEEVHETLRQIARSPGMDGVRVYDEAGRIIFSSAAGEIGTSVDQQAEACVLCHESGTPLRSVKAESRVRVYRTPEGEHVLGMISPIENEPVCASPSCHPPPAKQSVLGVLDIRMRVSEVDEAVRRIREQTVLATALTVLLLGIVLAVSIYRFVRIPVRRLMEGTQRIARGDLESRIAIRSRDEIGQLAESFNTMSESLAKARAEITGWSRALEAKVAAKTEELGRAQRQIVHMEKMASLGKLAATVAHEINNPLSGILTYSKLVSRELAGSGATPSAPSAEVARYLDLIQKETARCGEIVRNLLLFSRTSGGEFARHSLNAILERSLLLVRHHLQMANITLVTHPLAGNDGLVCDAGQIEQALIALFVNAVEAMRGGGTLTVAAADAGEEIEISVSDTGRGIEEAALPHIFEPFFSTKAGEGGVGLGLSVVYGIVQRHAGRIDVESQPGQGATFRLRLPRKEASHE